jgi:hypothetical protein
METTQDAAPRSWLKRVLFWLCFAMLVYLFATGPITRWAPEFAEKIYAPLSSLVDNNMFGRMLRGWLKLWGVDVDE